MNRPSSASAVVSFRLAHASARIEMQDIFDNDTVVMRARIHGSDVGAPVSSHERSVMRSKGLLKPILPIDGVLCRVHTLTCVHTACLTPHVGQAYVHVRLANPLKERIHIFHARVQGYDERFFVVPSRVIEEAFLRAPHASRSFNVPLEQRPVRPLARINFWPYQDAWHLIRLETASP